MTRSILLVVDEELKRSIRRAAEDDDRSMSSWIRHISKEAIREAEGKQITQQQQEV